MKALGRRARRFDGAFDLLAGPSMSSPTAEGRKTLETKSKLRAPGQFTCVQLVKCSERPSVARFERIGERSKPSNFKAPSHASCARYEKSANTVHQVSPI